jgi:hypothetical protein
VENLKKEMKTAASSTKEGEAEKEFEEVSEVSPSSSSHSHSRAGYPLASPEEIQALLSPLKTEIQRIQLYRNKSESLLEKEKEDKENRENQLGDEEETHIHPHRPSSETSSNKKNKKQQPSNENKNRKASQRQQQRKAEKDQMDFQDLFFKEAQSDGKKGNDQQEIQRPFSPSDLAMMTSSLALDSGRNKTNVAKPVIQFDPNKWNINNRNDSNHNNNNEDDEFFLPPISGRQPSQAPQSQQRTSRSAEFDSRRTFSAGSNVGEGPPSVSSSSNPYSQSRRVKPPKQQGHNGADRNNDSNKVNRSPRTNRFHYSQQQQQQNEEDQEDEESEGNRMDFSPRDDQPDYEIEGDEDEEEDQEEEEEGSNEIETNWLRHKKLLVDKVREFVEC